MPKQYHINGTLLRNSFLKLPYNVLLKERSRALRKAHNLPEVLFWMQVNSGKFHGLDFDRQKIIGNFIVDFYVKSLGLIVEIDGETHEWRQEHDEVRENWLRNQGCRIIRFTSTEVRFHMDQTMKNLEEFILQEYSM